jgi:integrase
MTKPVLAFDYAQALARRTQVGHAGPLPRKNPAELFINSHKMGTSRKTSAWQLDVAARLLGYGKDEAGDWALCPWWNLKYEDIEDLRGHLLEKVNRDEYVPGLANCILYAVKGVMKVVWRMSASGYEYLSDGAWLRIADITKIPGKKLRKPRRTPTDDEFARLLTHLEADISPRGRRDLALVGVSGMAGPRASELVALDLADYDRDGKRLRMPQIKTQTSEEDIWQPLEPPVTDWLDWWIAIRGKQPGPLFSRLEHGGMGTLQRIQASGLTTAIIARRGEEVEIENLTVHSLRRYFVTRMLRHTGDLALTSSLVRHGSTVTTATFYDQRDSTDKREAIRRVGLPTQPSGDEA